MTTHHADAATIARLMELEADNARLKEELADAQANVEKWRWMQQHDVITRRMTRYEWLLRQDCQYALLGRDGVETAIDSTMKGGSHE